MSQPNQPYLAILFMCLGMFCISVNDMIVKALAGSYPLYQIVFVRAVIGLGMAMAIIPFEGGFRKLLVAQPALHVLRVVLIICANISVYAALAAMPLATATALYFVAPLFITLLAIPILGERVGPRRIAAISFGFLGVLVILWPELQSSGNPGWVAILPIIAAAGYATMSVLTRLLSKAPASVLSFNVQVAFLITAVIAYIVAGDGRFWGAGQPASVQFLLRPWVWPPLGDLWLFGLIGLSAGIVGYAIAQAYRLTAAAVVAPFEYMLMLYALFWGWLIFHDWPQLSVFLGASIIIGSGIYIVWRERRSG
jgi:S-adenosylmethionine uptake transporter